MNLKVALVKRPDQTFPQSLDLFQIFYTGPPDHTQLKDEEVIIKNRYISIDAAMRVWMSGVKTYMDPVNINDVMNAFCVGEVAYSKSKKFAKGDIVSGMLGWQKFAALHSSKLMKLPKEYPNPQNFLGVLGISGLTAYFGLKEVGEIKKGDFVVVSAASGAVGEIAVGLARIWGCEVVGLAGSAEKCEYVTKVLGAAYCINYKKENVLETLKKVCPRGIDVYFDNVGGQILDDVLSQINDSARIICCGAISSYNDNKNMYRLKNYPRLIIKRAKMQGYIYFDYKDKIKGAVADLMGLVQTGQLKFREDVVIGLDSAPRALQKLFIGDNNGKVLVKVLHSAEDETYYDLPNL